MFKNRMKKLLSAVALSTLAFGTLTSTSTYTVSAETGKDPEVENIIFLIGDGMGPAYQTAYRYFKDDLETEQMEDTIFDPYLVGMQTTYSADAYFDGGEEDEQENIPDSAATATAMSSGVKTYNGAIAVDRKKEDTKTVLETAKQQGKATGLVATSQINHATPAAFGTHDESRNNYDQIADDYFDNLVDGEHVVDVLLGGGIDFFIRDDRNLAKEFQKDGYSYIETRKKLLHDKNEQVLGLFAPIGLDKAIDRTEGQPSLAEMTMSALERLKKDEDGFFLMVEGSQIDWAGHDNDIVAAMSEMEDFEQAFAKAIEFAEQDGETLVVATADHSTGGLSVGRDGEYQWNPEIIRAAEKTPDYMAAQIAEGADITAILEENIGFQLTEAEIDTVKNAYKEADKQDEEALVLAIDDAIEKIFDIRSGTGWTTEGHTGVDVPVYAYGPGADHFTGHIDNTDNAANIFRLLGASSDEEAGDELAETATNYPNGILAGVMLALVGGLLVFKRKTSTKKQGQTP
ncbi:alkaline phosphatase [Sediminibacillus albus]|uniref:Alkaline phosphatase n=1 Tax=Sediminibacillus albus TaxID=407036 RepID=A0A1G8YDF3_9BACI|nr:alkaline phosphatase [Sediminibacillus albus]SDK00070.1 alkaline phosphatase [Sediminibacillus albus]